MIKIEMPNGSTLTEADMRATVAAEEYNQPVPPVVPPRTIAVVANELEAAISASLRVPKLREELDALLGRKKRAARKGNG